LIDGRGTGCEIDGFEDLGIDFAGFFTLEREFHLEETISESLDSDSNRSMPEIGVLGLDYWVVVVVDHTVHVLN
jgi:hypothetical protein